MWVFSMLLPKAGQAGAAALDGEAADVGCESAPRADSGWFLGGVFVPCT